MKTYMRGKGSAQPCKVIFFFFTLQYDLRSQRLFLKRLAIEGLDEKDFYLGNTIVVLSRQLKITEYADSTTREIISSKRQR